MKKAITLLKGLSLWMITITILIIIAMPTKAFAIESSNTKKIRNLQEKVAQSYSSKFCNGIGIGISTEGALRLTINENKESKFNPSLWFELASSGKTNLERIDKDQLADDVSIRIIRDCGAAIGFSGKEGIDSFKNYFISIRNEMDDKP